MKNFEYNLTNFHDCYRAPSFLKKNWCTKQFFFPEQLHLYIEEKGSFKIRQIIQ